MTARSSGVARAARKSRTSLSPVCSRADARGGADEVVVEVEGVGMTDEDAAEDEGMASGDEMTTGDGDRMTTLLDFSGVLRGDRKSGEAILEQICSSSSSEEGGRLPHFLGTDFLLEGVVGVDGLDEG